MAAPTALQREVRRALLTLAKADVGLTALVPVASIDPDGEPSWPFITIEAPRAIPLKASCVRGATVRMDVHAFAGPREEGGAIAETGYDHVSRIGAAIETALSDRRIDLEGGATARVTLSDMQLLRDAEPESWHWFCQANGRVIAE